MPSDPADVAADIVKIATQAPVNWGWYQQGYGPEPFDGQPTAMEGLQNGEVDLALGMTPTATAMWHWDIAFGPPVFYDGQGFLVRRDANARTVADLRGSACAYRGQRTVGALSALHLPGGLNALWTQGG